MRLRPVLFSSLALVAAAGVGVVIGGDRLASLLAGEDAAGDEIKRQPPGFWTPATLSTIRRPKAGGGTAEPAADPDGRASAEERARLISLPYLAGRRRADAEGGGAGRGVVLHRPDRAWPGVNLYNSGHGPEAILIDMDGELLHRWRYPFARAFPGAHATTDTQFFRRVHLFPDGRLLALYQTGGLIFLDARSRPLGTCGGNYYNDFWIDEPEPGAGGRVWTLAKEARGKDRDAELDDFLVLLRYRGRGEGCREERRISLTRALAESPFAGVLEPMAPRGDVLHANTVVELGEEASTPGLPEAFAPGRLLVSLREIDTLAVVDPDSGLAVWARRGPWHAQHEPSLLADGRLLLFDNRGGAGGFSRVLEVDPGSGEIVRSRGGDPPERMHSSIAGTCARLANGDTLVTLSVSGRALELAPDGEVVWQLETPHRAGPDDELIAMLFEVQRLPAALAGEWTR